MVLPFRHTKKFEKHCARQRRHWKYKKYIWLYRCLSNSPSAFCVGCIAIFTLWYTCPPAMKLHIPWVLIVRSASTLNEAKQEIKFLILLWNYSANKWRLKKTHVTILMSPCLFDHINNCQQRSRGWVCWIPVLREKNAWNVEWSQTFIGNVGIDGAFIGW